MNEERGLSCPVLVPDEIDWRCDYPLTTLGQLVDLPPEELGAVDPIAMNLIVGKGIPALAHLDIAYYQDIVNRWVADFTQRCLPTRIGLPVLGSGDWHPIQPGPA